MKVSLGLALLIIAGIIYYVAGMLWSWFNVYRFMEWRRQLRDKERDGGTGQ